MELDFNDLDVYAIDDYDLIDILNKMSDLEQEKIFEKIILKIQDNPENIYMNNKLILSLSPKIRIKYMDYFDFDYISLYDSTLDFIKEMTDIEDIFLVCKIALSKIRKDNIYSFDKLLLLVPDSKKIEFLEFVSKKENELKINIIDNINVSDVLKCFNSKQRFDILKDVIFTKFNINYDNEDCILYEPNIRMNSFCNLEILSVFIDNKNLSKSEIFDILLYLGNESKKVLDVYTKKPMGFTNIEKILKLFYENGYDIYEIIDLLVDNDLFDLLGFDIKELPEEFKKDIIIYIMQLNNKKMSVSLFNFFRLIGSLSETDNRELFIKCCLVEKTIDYLEYIPMISDSDVYSSLYYFNIVFEILSTEELNECFDRINAAFSQIDNNLKYSDKYPQVIFTYAKRYGVEVDKLIRFVEKFDYNILKYLENDKIIDFINMDNLKINKLFELFNEDTTIINTNIINDVLNSLLQRQFMLKEKDTYNIFSTFEFLYQNNDLVEIRELLDKMLSEYDFNFILKNNNCSLNELYNKIISGYLDLLHMITNNYIAHKREMFLKEKLPKSQEVLSMQKIVSRDFYKREMMNHGSLMLKIFCEDLKNVNFSEKQRNLLFNEDLLDRLLYFKRNPKDYNLGNDDKKYLSVLNEILDILYDNKVNFFYYDPELSFNKEIMYDYIPKEISKEFLIGILLESNYDGLMNLLSNEEDYESLKSFLKKYKMIGWQDTFSNVMKNCDLFFDVGTLAGLLSNYDKIRPHIEAKSTLTKIIDYCNCYSSVSNYYRILFGTEDFSLIAANEGKNKASMSRYERLKGCADLVSSMYEKKYFSVPTMNENIELSNGKKIQVVLGNATNMMNLTYGERTCSCMRKGGAFNNLFEYCATSENGFHIRFVNPETGKFVSRVSGIRNGNTIFLNELRISLDDEYSNADLYESIKGVAESLIQMSRNSEFHIDNVLITSDYALEDYKSKNQELNLSVDNKKIALRNLPFNYDTKGILLANSVNSNIILPYKFSDNVPKYDSVRDDVKIYHGSSAINRIMQIRIINDLINGVSLDNVNTEFTDEIPNYIISGEDYYISFKNDKVDVFILDSCKQNQKTLNEINQILVSKNIILDDSMLEGVNRL